MVFLKEKIQLFQCEPFDVYTEDFETSPENTSQKKYIIFVSEFFLF